METVDNTTKIILYCIVLFLSLSCAERDLLAIAEFLVVVQQSLL